MFFNKKQHTIWLGLGAIILPSLSIANTAPSISGIPETHAALGSEYVFQPTISDADGDALRLIIRRLPTWLRFDANSGELRGTPSATDLGLHKKILLIAKDKSSTSKLAAFNIEVFNPAPIISGSPTTSVDAGQHYQFQAQASDSNGDTLSFSIENKPNWARFNNKTGLLSGTPNPTKTRNYRDIKISVSDGHSTVALAAFDISVVSGVMSSACTRSIATGTSLSCQLDKDGVREFVLIDPPRGFSIQPKTGLVHWTPTSDQVGQHYVGITARAGANTVQWTASIDVSLDKADATGIYVAPDGDDNAAGSASAPFQSIKKAADRAQKGQTIYLRGGTYYNAEYGQSFTDRRYGSMARITTSGTGSKPITLRPYGNEYVKLISDVTTLQFKDAQHWVVENLELQGTAQSLSLSDALSSWWAEDNKKTTGRGISTNSSQNITIRNNVIHDFAGAGIGNNGSDMIKVENNIIYNTSWWSTAGTHGVANSYLTTAAGNENKEGLVMTGNLVFANQSRIISHVFSKGNVDLVIDEGNGLHAQNNSKTFDGSARIENNVLLFNGKAGFGINTMDKVKVKNNAFYQNAQVVNTGELAVQSSSPSAVSGNLFHPLIHRKTLKNSSKDYSLLKGNASTYAVDSASITTPNVLQTTVFQDPDAFDFTPAAGISNDMGVPVSHLNRMKNRIQEYGIKVQKPALETIDESYVCALKKRIFNDWDQAADHLQNITLTDREDNHKQYTFAERHSFSCDK